MTDLEAVHARLREILTRHRGDLVVTKDGPGGVYAQPELAASVSPALAERKQGKACFNFREIDEALLTELEDLTARGIPGFREVAEAAAVGRR